LNFAFGFSLSKLKKKELVIFGQCRHDQSKKSSSKKNFKKYKPKSLWLVFFEISLGGVKLQFGHHNRDQEKKSFRNIGHACCFLKVVI